MLTNPEQWQGQVATEPGVEPASRERICALRINLSVFAVLGRKYSIYQERKSDRYECLAKRTREAATVMSFGGVTWHADYSQLKFMPCHLNNCWKAKTEVVFREEAQRTIQEASKLILP